MKKIIWVVWDANGMEISRHTSRIIAKAVAHEIGGTFHKYESK